MVFVSSRMALLPQEVVPTESYMKLLREGAADQFIDPLYQVDLCNVSTGSLLGVHGGPGGASHRNSGCVEWGRWEVMQYGGWHLTYNL